MEREKNAPTWQELKEKRHRKKKGKRLFILFIVILALAGAVGGVCIYAREEQAREEEADPKAPAEDESAWYARVLSIYGNEACLKREDTGAEETIYIPVGMTVYTTQGSAGSFSGLAEGDRVLVIVKTATGEPDRMFMVAEETESSGTQGSGKPGGSRSGGRGESGGGPGNRGSRSGAEGSEGNSEGQASGRASGREGDGEES